MYMYIANEKSFLSFCFKCLFLSVSDGDIPVRGRQGCVPEVLLEDAGQETSAAKLGIRRC